MIVLVLVLVLIGGLMVDGADVLVEGSVEVVDKIEV